MPDKTLDFTRLYIPHDYLTVREMYGSKRVIRTFAPLPSVVAHFHSLGYFPPIFHKTAKQIIPTPEELLKL